MTCIDCGKIIGRYSTRCRSCSNKFNRLKNSEGCKKAYSEGRRRRIFGSSNLGGMASKEWRDSHPKELAEARKKNRDALKGRRRITDENLLKKTIYREQCSFNLAGCIDRVEGFNLLKQFGMYDKHRNTGGVVRDHILSINDGFRDNIDPKIISHPANCRFIPHKKNASKSKRSDVTLDQLLQKIERWNEVL